MKKMLAAVALAIALLGSGCNLSSRSSSESPTPVVDATTGASVATLVTGSPRHDRAALIARIQEVFDDERFSNAHWGVMIKSMKTGEVWYDRNGQRMFNPASNQKIPTTAAALLGLGLDFRFTTTVAHSGSVADGTLDGNLIVFGDGDPTFYTRFIPDSRDHFRAWARDLKARGIHRISGDIIGDDNAWDDVHTGNGWPARDFTAWYWAEFGPLQFNENYVDIKVIPPATTEGIVQLEPNVPSNYYTLIPDIRVVDSGSNSVRLDREVLTNRIHLRGQVRAGSASFEVSPTITNPTLWFVTVLHETLREEGIEITGQPVDCDDLPGWDHKPEDFNILIAHKSPPLEPILQGLFKRSQNMYAETMPHVLAWKRTGRGTWSEARRAVQDILRSELGVDPAGYIFSDGSGLSRYNYISPATIIAINEGMRRHELGEVWYNLQAIAGVDGTLRSRMRGTAAEANVRGKTGTIANTRALSGYVTTAAGEELLFAFLVNGHTQASAATDSVTDTAAVLLAEYEGN